MEDSTVFVSYACADREHAQLVVSVLQQVGLEVWWDECLKVGDDFPPEIEERLQTARCVVVLWSEASTRSRWVRAEATLGARRGVLVPARIDNSQPPLEFLNFHTLDLSSWFADREQNTTDRLIQSVKSYLGETIVRPPSLPPVDRVEELRRYLLTGPDVRALRAAAYELEAITKMQPNNVQARLLLDDCHLAILRESDLRFRYSYDSDSPDSSDFPDFPRLGCVETVLLIAGLAFVISDIFGFGLLSSILLGLLALLCLSVLFARIVGALSWLQEKLRQK